MNAQITYHLSEIGQRAALATGLDGAEQQTITVEVGADDLCLFGVAADGKLAAAEIAAPYWRDLKTPRFDAVLTSPGAIHALRAWQETVAAAGAAKARRAADDAAIEAAARAQQIEAMRQLVATDPDAVRDSDAQYPAADFDDALKTALCAIWSERTARAARLESLPGVPRVLTALDAPDKDAGWSKVLNSIDPTAVNGYGYHGEWGTSAQIGEVVLIVRKSWQGSRKRGQWVYDAEAYVRGPRAYHCARDAAGAIIANGDHWSTSMREPL